MCTKTIRGARLPRRIDRVERAQVTRTMTVATRTRATVHGTAARERTVRLCISPGHPNPGRALTCVSVPGERSRRALITRAGHQNLRARSHHRYGRRGKHWQRVTETLHFLCAASAGGNSSSLYRRQCLRQCTSGEVRATLASTASAATDVRPSVSSLHYQSRHRLADASP